MSAFRIDGIEPVLNMLSSDQRFIFGNKILPEPLGSLGLDNIFTPVIGMPSVINFETRNKDLSGFRWIHTTNVGDTFGSLKLQSFVNAQPTGTDILLFNQDGSINFNSNISFNQLSVTSPFIVEMANNNISAVYLQELGTTKGYFEYVKGNSTPDMVLLASSVDLTLQCFNPGTIHFITSGPGETDTFTMDNNYCSSNVDIRANNIGSNAIPERGYIFSNNGVEVAGIVFNKISNQVRHYTLGTLLGNPSFIFSINGTDVIEIGNDYNLNLYNHKIINLANPINPGDAVNKAYADSLISGGTVTLTGDINGSGPVGTDIETTLNTVSIDKLAGYPADNTLFLRGDGEWTNNFAKIGVNVNPTDTGVIQFANGNSDAKIILNKDNPDNSFDMSGIGFYSTYGTIYHTPIGKSHVFFSGFNASFALEISPIALKLGYGLNSTDFRKIVFYEDIGSSNPNQTYAIGVELDGVFPYHTNLRNQVETINDTFNWCYGIDANTSGEWMRLSNAGLNLYNKKLFNLLDPVDPQDAATRGYVDNLVANLPALVNVTGASQTFLYSSNYNTSFITKNSTVPTSGNDSTIDLRLLNSTNGGYRLKHTLTSGGLFGGLGSLSLDALSSFGDVTNFINFGFSSLFAGVGFAGGVPNTTFGAATSDTILATLSVNGGPQNVTNESSCFRVVSSDNSTKIELKNTSASGRLYELRSNSDGTFDIVDRTSVASRFKIGVTGAITTGVWNGSIISSQYGGTGVNNGGRTLSYGGNVSIGSTFTTNGAFSVNGSFTVNQNFSTNQPFSTNGAVTMQGPFTTSGTITLRTLTLGGSADVTLPISGTLATLSNTLNQFGLPTADLNVNSFKLTNVATPTLPTDGVNKAYADSLLTTFGPNVPLNFSGLNFNWTYASSTNPTPYQFTNTFTDSQISKNFKYRVLTNDVLTREWNHDYTLIGNSDVNGIYKINYVGGGQTFTPINIVVYPFATSQNLMTIGVPINMGGFEVRNAANPTTPQSLATRAYVDSTVGGSSVTLTGAVTGSGSGTINTVLNPTVNVNSASYAFNLNNSNFSGITEFQISYGIPYLKFGVNTAGSGNYIDSIFDPFIIRMGGVDRFIFSSVGNLGIGGTGPTQAKLVVNGGVQNVTGEESALRVVSSLNNVKIELQSTAVGGKLYELRSSSTGAFDITDRTSGATRFTIGSTGNVGVATSTPNSIFQIANQAGQRRVLTLFEVANNSHQFLGFGTISNPAGLSYQVAATTDNHTFFAATSATTSNEVARIGGNGTSQFTKIAGYAATKPYIGDAGSLGVGATFTINGSSSELSGTITIFSGTSGNSSGPLVGVSLMNVMPNSSWGVILFPGNAAATQVTDRIFVVVANNYQFTINARTALANNTTYTWNYHIIGA